MRVLLIYDIVNDRKRAKAADLCLDYGLDRAQYSAFVGRLERTHQETLLEKLRALIGDTPARIALYPIDESAWRKRLTVEQGMEDGVSITSMNDFDADSTICADD